MKRKSVERTFNCGTMTKAEMHSMIISALRGASRWWKPKQKAISRARVSPGKYKCELCGTIGPPSLPAPPGKKRKVKNIVADHIRECVDETVGWVSYDDFIKRLFVEEEHFQAICAVCNKEKTDRNQAIRRNTNKNK